jgi:predicted RNA-binding Zn ribbon-like protein
MMSPVTLGRAPLELVRLFVNTLDVEDGVDVLDRGWLVDHGLVDRAETVAPDELRRLAELREAIRDLLLANNGVPVDVAAAAATLDDAARRARLTVRFRPDATTEIEPEVGGGLGAAGRVLAVVAAAIETENWSRLKACRAEDCRWAFYDAARNRSRAWCSMDVCGNRAKARAFRARR